MALIADGGGKTETAAERNARLQAAFNKASTSTKTTTSTYVPAPSYTAPKRYVPAPSYTPPTYVPAPAYTPPPAPTPAAALADTFTGYDVQGIQSLAGPTPTVEPATSRFVEPQQTSIFGEPIDLGGRIGLSFADQPLAQEPYQDERQYDLSYRYTAPSEPESAWQRSIDFTDYNTRQYELEQFGTPPQDQPSTSSWTQSELDMLGGMSVDAAIAWGSRYTGQALFGDVDPRTGEQFQGAFDRETGELVNPNLMPSLLSPAFANQLGISEEQRVMLGYNPDYPYELLDIAAGGGGGIVRGGGGGGGGGGYSPSRGYGYSPSNPLISWRIGF